MTSLHRDHQISNAETCNANCEAYDTMATVTNVPVHNYVEKRYDNITKSQNDRRVYRGLVLNNKMKVLLVSDPKTDKSAAALDVYIGFMSDPDELPGLAHFCEHMLFCGTRKYPQENEYTMFLTQNGGSCNASTYMDHTTYYFDVSPDKLDGALDRFAQPFIAPLFTEDMTNRELNAIHSEHEKNVPSDEWRFNQLNTVMLNHEHPFGKFGTGNKETLYTIPKQKNINVREKLLEFHNTYYSANIMALCVLGKESLDELERMVVQKFSEVENKGVDLPAWQPPSFDMEHVYYMVPIKDTRSLNLTFDIPDLDAHFRSAPEYYISHNIGHEGEGSLLSGLKAKGWCNSLMAGTRSAPKGFDFFNIRVDLTEEGMKHIDDIILMTFQYINMLKKEGPNERIFNEIKDIAIMCFRFKELISPRRYVSMAVDTLQNYPMEEILTAHNIYSEWRPDLIELVMDYLTPQNLRLLVKGKAFEDIATETEPWYGTKYGKKKLMQETLDKWTNAGLNPIFHLHPVNEFIPTKFDIKPREENANKFPVIIEDTPLIRLWYKQDDEFLVPKCNLSCNFVSPVAYIDPISCNLCWMFVVLFHDSLNEYVYAAGMAGLEWKLQHSRYGVILGIVGYDDKQHVLLNRLLDEMFDFKVDPKRFEIFKEVYIRTSENFKANQPFEHSTYYLSTLLSELEWSKDELLEAASQLTVERLQEFIPQLFSKVHVECLIHGNVTISEATETAKMIESKLTSKIPRVTPLLAKQLTLYREIRLENGSHFLYEAENEFHTCSCTQIYYQCGMLSTETNMLSELLAQIIREPCFYTLRTQEQLGYIVFSGLRNGNCVQGLRVIVQSNRHPQYVEQRIDLFMQSMVEHIENMSEELFNDHKESLAVQYLEKPKRLSTLFIVFWSEILSQEYNFDRRNIEVAYLRTIKKEQLLEFYKEILNKKTQRKLSVHVLSTAEKSKPSEKEDAEKTEVQDALTNNTNGEGPKKIEDILLFKIGQALHPLLPPYINIPKKGVRSSKL